MSELLVLGIPNQTSLWGLNVVIHATVLAVVSLLVALLFRRAAAMRYWVLCFGLALVFVSPVISGLIQATGSSWLKITVTPPVSESASRTMNPDVGSSTDDASQPNDADQRVLADSLAVHPVAHQDVNEIAVSLADDTSIAAVQNAPTPESITPATPTNWIKVSLRFLIAPLVLIWVIGSAILLLRMSIGWLRMSRILRAAKPISDERFQIALDRACSTAGCRRDRRPQLVTSDAVSGPIAAGVLRGKVVLPESLLLEVDPKSLADVLIHEVAHVVRRDQIVVLLQNLVAAFYWPHPLVRKLNRELAKAREEVCDNFVLAATEAPTYSRTLLSLAQLIQQSEAMPGSVGFFTNRWKLEHRIAGLLDNQRNRTTFLSKRGWLFVAATTAVLAVLTCLGTITIATAQIDDAVSSELAIAAKATTVSGVVLKPDGSPAAGATVRAAALVYADMRGVLGNDYESPMKEVVADKNGRFEISIETEPYGELPVKGTKWEDFWKLTMISATVPGFAGQWTRYKDVEGVDTVTLQLVEDAPIRGRVIGLEGRPVSGVTIEVKDIRASPNESLDAWLQAVRNGEPAWTAATHISRQIDSRMLGVPDTVTSDSDGAFEIKGVGRDRCIRLQAHGNGIAFEDFQVVTRPLKPLTWNDVGRSDSPASVYGAELTFTGRPSRTVNGTLTDAKTGMPLAGVDVAVTKMSGKNVGGYWLLPTRTDPQGRFRIDGMPKGEGNRLMFRPTDDQPYFMREIDVPESDGMDPIAIDVQLHRGIWIEGKVVDKQSHEPVAGVRVYYLPLLTNQFADELPEFDRGAVDGQQSRYQTDANGKYRLVGLPGAAIVGVQSIHRPYRAGVGYDELTAPKDERGRVQTYRNPITPGPKWPDSMVQIDPDEETQRIQLDFELDPGRTISVSVFDESNEWLTGGILVTGKSGTSQGVTIERAPVDVTNIAPNESRVIAVHHQQRGLGLVHHVTSANIADGNLRLTAQRCARISGRLVNDGEPLSGISVIPDILPTGDFSQSLATVTTDEDGVFNIVLPPGCKYKLRMEGQPFRYARFEEDIEISAGDEIDLGTLVFADDRKFKRTKESKADSTTMDRSGLDANGMQFSGFVVDPDGKPVVGAKVYHVSMLGLTTTDEKQSMPVATSGQDGAFEFTIPISKSAQLHDERMLRYATVIATLEGFAPAVLNVHDSDPGKTLELRLAKEDAPLAGRILDLQGQPIAGVRVTFNALQSLLPGSAGIAAWRKAIEDRPDGMAIQNEYFSYVSLPTFLSDREVQTDANGRFEMKGFGPERIVSLIIESPRIESQAISLVTGNKIDPISVPWYENAPQLGTLHYFPNHYDYVAAPTRPIVGVVSDLDTGEPLSGFKVSGGTVGNPMHAVEATTDNEGRFRLTGLPIGKKQNLSITPPKDQPYIAVDRSFELVQGKEPLALNLQAPRGVWVEGKVVHQQSKKAVGARISYFVFEKNMAYQRLYKSGLGLHGELSGVQTNDDGSFRIAVLPGRGIVAARGFRDDYLMGVGDELIVEGRQSDGVSFLRTAPFLCSTTNYHTVVEVNPANVDARVAVTIGLDPGLTAEGRVLDARGNPLAGALIRGTRPMSYWRENETADFKAIGFKDGKPRQLLFWHETQNLAGQIVISPGTTNATVQLQPAATLTARLLDKDGAPITDTQIVSYSHGRNEESDVEHDFVGVPQSLDIRTDNEGRFRIPSLVPGLKYAFGFENEPGRFPVLCIKSITLKPGETRKLGDLKPLPGPHDNETTASPQKQTTIRGTVLGPNGQPATAALWVGGPRRSGEWSPTPMSVAWTAVGKSGTDGRFQITIPQPGTESVTSRPSVVRLAATGDGLGFAWTDVTMGQAADKVTLRLVNDTPIRGRIVTLDGTPAANVKLNVVAVTAPDSLPDSSEIIKNAQLGSGVYTNWPAWPGGSPLTKTVVTDSDGRFQLSGLGSERHVRLEALGDGLAATRLSIITREKPSDSASGAIAVRTGLSESKYFAEFTHVAVPERIVRGTVVDQTSGKPIPDVKVIAPTSWASRKQPAVTDASGEFVIQNVPKATEYSLELSPRGANHFRSSPTVPDPAGSEPLVVNLTLASSIKLRGRVVDEVTGEGAQGEIVYNPLFPNQAIETLGVDDVANPLSTVQTDTEGNFEIPVLPGPGAVSAQVTGEKYATVLLKEQDLRKIFPEGELEAKPNALGQFEYLPTAAGGQSHGLMGLSEVHAVELLNLSQDDPVNEITLSLRHSLTLQGAIVDEQGKPVSGATVIGLGPSPVSMTPEPLETNLFSVTGLRPGNMRTLLFLQQERSLGAIVDVKGDQSGLVKVELKPTGSISGSLVDSEGDPITNGYVTLRPERISLLTELWTASVDDEGRFTVDNLPAGVAFWLHARIQGHRMELFVRGNIRTESGEQLDLGVFRQKNKNQFKAVKMNTKPGSQDSAR